MRIFVFYFIVSLLVIFGVEAEITFKKGAPHVKLSQSGGGVLKGKIGYSRDGRPFNSFTGIKFGTISERFAASVVTESKWDGVKEAVEMGAMCTQMAFPPENGKVTNGEEDCLYLNVYVPMSANPVGDSKGLPVMVWIFGGGFLFGEGYQYRPQHFMDEEVILVTINHRLSVYGFLSTGDEVVPGNNALKDQVTALTWVQKNIKSFAGNPEKVTIFGESTGGASTHFLHLSPLTKGLFHQVISQSGSALSPSSYTPNPRAAAVELATYMNCPTTSNNPSDITSIEILTCLRAASTEELSNAEILFRVDKVWPKYSFSFNFGPVVEPKSTPNAFITESPLHILQGDYPLKKIPWIVGLNKDEGTGVASLSLTDEENLKDLDENWDDVAPTAFMYKDFVSPNQHTTVAKKLRDFYFGSNPVSLETRKDVVNIYSDFMFNYGMVRSALEALRKKVPVYLYQFTRNGPMPAFMSFPLHEEEENLVDHGEDLTPLFDFEENGGAAHGQDFVNFSKNFVKLWASFAIHGKPTHTWGNASDKKWKPATATDLKNLTFFRINDNPEMIKNPYTKRMEFWKKLYEKHYEQILLNKKGKEEL